MNNKPRALIYCRVSSDKQVKEGNGLSSQEKRCRNYAEGNGHKVVKVFTDKGVSGGVFERPGMQKLLDYLDANPTENFMVIFDDLKRFARDTIFHFKLKSELGARGAIVDSPNFNFEDSPEGEFVETIIAAHGQMERKQNQREVCQKMKARLENGFWCLQPPIGYKHVKAYGGGKTIAPINPEWENILKYVLEGYADGRFLDQKSICEFVNKQELPRVNGDKPYRMKEASRMLRQPLYTGYLFHKGWNVPVRKADHKAIISQETFIKIQNRLNNNAPNLSREDKSEKFPLRNWVRCSCCGNPLTASDTTNDQGKKFAYYRCKKTKKVCVQGGKSVAKKVIEDKFLEVLNGVKPNKAVLDLMQASLREAWHSRLDEVKSRSEKEEVAIRELEEKSRVCMDLAVNACNKLMIKKYEEEIVSIEREIGEKKFKIQMGQK